MADIFISYSHADGGYAHRLADELRSRQFDAWIDDRIDYGDQWPRIIEENLATCRIFIVIMSPRSFNSMWVQNEISYAQANQKTIFPLLLEGGVWLSIAAMQYVDVRQGNLPPERFYERLARELNRPLPPIPAKPATPPPGRMPPRRWPVTYMVGSIVLLAALFIALLLSRRGGAPPPPVPTGTFTPTAIIGPEITYTSTFTITPSPTATDTPTPVPLYKAGIIPFVINKDGSDALYMLDREGNPRLLLEQAGITELTVLSVSPPSIDASAPRYLAVRFSQENLLNLAVLNTQDASVVIIAQAAKRLEATYLEDGTLLVEKQDGDTAIYTLYQMDGSGGAEIYSALLILPTRTNTPGGAP